MKAMIFGLMVLTMVGLSGCASTIGEHYSDSAFIAGREAANAKKERSKVDQGVSKLAQVRIDKRIKAIETGEALTFGNANSEPKIRQEYPPVVVVSNSNPVKTVRFSIGDGVDSWVGTLKPGELLIYPDQAMQAAQFWSGQEYKVKVWYVSDYRNSRAQGEDAEPREQIVKVREIPTWNSDINRDCHLIIYFG